MKKKTILLVDDEQGFLEGLADALEYEGHRVLKARTVEEAYRTLEIEEIDLITIDIMMPWGESLTEKTPSSKAGLLLCEELASSNPQMDIFCLSVVSDLEVIRKIESLGVKFLRKGETPLRTVLNMVHSRLTGVAYSTERT